MSENKLAVALPKPGVSLEACVVSDGVWQLVQPMALKRLRPLAIDVGPPGEVVEGVGWSRNCMNALNSPASLVTVEAVGPSECVMSSGEAAPARVMDMARSPLPNWASHGRPPTCVNMSLEIAPST